MATFDQFIILLRQEFGEQDAGKKFEFFVNCVLMSAVLCCFFSNL
jgi:hypothetical protein